MKKNLFTALCFLLLLAYVSSLSAFQLHAGRPQATGCAAAATETCGLAGDGAGYSFGNTQDYEAAKFTASASGTICKVVISLKKGASTTESVRLGIYTDNSGEPGTLIGSWSDWVTAASVTTSFTDITFSNISASGIESSTTYWIVADPGTADDTTNVYTWEYKSTGCSPEEINQSTDEGSTWTETSTIRVDTYEIHYTE
jgi:hypothetical protein